MYIYDSLQESINKKRQEMIDLAVTNGFTDQETVKCSQELDHLLNLCNQQTLNKTA